MTVSAYILIQTEVGKAAQVATEVSSIEGVVSAEDVTGPYDVIVRAEARNVDELGKLVVSKVQNLDGITRTLTCPVVHISVPAAVRRRRPVSLRTRGAVACAVVLLVAGCGDEPPAIDAPDLSAADASACRDLVAALPDELAGQERVDVTGDTEYGAAWGDPAIVLTCGVGRPDDFTDTSTCVQVDRTGWFVPDEILLSDDETLDVTTTELNFWPRVQLVIPGEYRPEGFTNGTGAIAPLIEQHLRRTGRCR